MKFFKKYFCRWNPDYCCVSIEKLLELLFLNAGSLNMIQVGANDGVLCDPLHKHIKSKKLKGIMLEPQSKVFERLKLNHKESKGLTFENVALGAEEAKTVLYKVKEEFVNQYKDLGGVASFDRNHVLQELRSNQNKLDLSSNGVIEDCIEEEKVDVTTYASLINKHDLTTLDLLMIDAEGYDFEAVTLFPFETLCPKSIVFEYKHLSKVQLQEIKVLLSKYGYTGFFSKNDVLFIIESN